MLLRVIRDRCRRSCLERDDFPSSRHTTRAYSRSMNLFRKTRIHFSGSCSGLDRAVDAAVDDDRLAREIAGLRRTQIGAEIGDLLRPPHAAHRDRLGEALELLLRRDAQAL